jgi:hypothetical protein
MEQAATRSRGVIVLMDNATYEENLTTAATRIKIPQGSQLIVTAAGWPEESQDDPLQPKVRVVGHLSAGLTSDSSQGKDRSCRHRTGRKPTPGTLISTAF